MPVKPPIFRPQGHQTYTEARATERARGYTKAWSKASTAYKRSNPLCLGCAAVGWTRATEVTDHIVPHKGNQALFWDSAKNFQPACRPHHDVVKQRIELLFAQGKATVADLRLDSEMAKALTLDLLG